MTLQIQLLISVIKYIFVLFINSLVIEDATWSRGDSGRPARAHKILIKFITRSADIVLVQDTFKQFNVTTNGS